VTLRLKGEEGITEDYMDVRGEDGIRTRYLRHKCRPQARGWLSGRSTAAARRLPLPFTQRPGAAQPRPRGRPAP